VIVVVVDPVAVRVPSVATTVEVVVDALPGVKVKFPESAVKLSAVNLST
jgi:hypothetical protein